MLTNTVTGLNEKEPYNKLETKVSDELKAQVSIPIESSEMIVLLLKSKETPVTDAGTGPSSDKPPLNLVFSMVIDKPDLRLMVVKLKSEPKMEIERKVLPEIVCLT